MIADEHVDVGVDIGGTKIDVVVMAGSVVLAREIRATPTDGSVLASVADTVASLVRQGGRSIAHVRAVGVGLPCVVDVARGTTTSGVNIALGTTEVGATLAEMLGVPVVLSNDVNSAAVGFAVRHRPDGNTVFVNFGTGVAAGIVLDGAPLSGDANIAGEIGHLQIDPTGPRCACGAAGCIEAFVGGAAISERWPELQTPTVASLLSAAAAGDPRATREITGMVRGIVSAIQAVALTVDAGVIVVGGGVARSWPELWPHVRRRIDALEEASPFAKTVGLGERILWVANDEFPYAAFGAASVARARLSPVLR